MSTLKQCLVPFALLLASASCDRDDDDVDAEAADVAEAPVASAQRHGKFAKLDADGDGALSPSEVEGHRIAPLFAELDVDGSGSLSPDELAVLKHKGKHGQRHGDPVARAAEMITTLDADKDGAISTGEANGHWLAKKFTDADKDGDGKLTADELVAWKSAHHRHRGEAAG